MHVIKFLGPHRRLVLGKHTLERDGEAVQITDAEFAALRRGRWEYEEIAQPSDGGDATATKDKE